MDEAKLLKLLCEVKSGATSVESAMTELRSLPFEELDGFARLDHHRAIRCGFPEVVFARGKSCEQIVRIVKHLWSKHDQVLVTGLMPEVWSKIAAELPDASYHETARLLTVDRNPDRPRRPGVVVATGGTADIPVAEEAAVTAEFAGSAVERLYDVGVAGIHRLLVNASALQKARVIVAVAGMEGALPSVIGGLVSVPVIAVPTSIGYGTSFNGLAALLAMLNGCAPGVSVVNIDNGFGAGFLAAMINRIGADSTEG